MGEKNNITAKDILSSIKDIPNKGISKVQDNIIKSNAKSAIKHSKSLKVIQVSKNNINSLISKANSEFKKGNIEDSKKYLLQAADEANGACYILEKLSKGIAKEANKNDKLYDATENIYANITFAIHILTLVAAIFDVAFLKRNEAVLLGIEAAEFTNVISYNAIKKLQITYIAKNKESLTEAQNKRTVAELTRHYTTAIRSLKKLENGLKQSASKLS